MDSLYGDIDVIGDTAETRKLQEQLEEMRRQLVKKDKEISDLTAQTTLLLDDKDKLEANMVSLYNTATVEIKRKDREIAELRAALLASRQGRPDDP